MTAEIIDYTPIIYSTIATIITVASSMWSIVKWQSNKREKDEATKAAILKEYTDKMHKDVTESLTTMNSKMTAMIEGLRKRADLTNGNVSFIRSDIADLQEDMLDLWESASNHEVKPSFSRDKKLKSLERRKRRRKIESDRIAQQEDKMT